MIEPNRLSLIHRADLAEASGAIPINSGKPLGTPLSWSRET